MKLYVTVRARLAYNESHKVNFTDTHMHAHCYLCRGGNETASQHQNEYKIHGAEV